MDPCRLFLVLGSHCRAQASTRPNFIIVLGDDIGTDAIGAYGAPNKDEIPNIDKRAATGLKFNKMKMPRKK